MESVNTSSTAARRKGKARADGPRTRRIWTRREEDFLISAIRDLIIDPKWKLDTGAFRNGFYGELERKIIMAFPGTDLRASPHIESKIKSWKKSYNVLHDMLRTSGFGWDDVTKIMVFNSEEVFQEYVKVHPEAASVKDKAFPYYEDWLVLFGNDRATGEEAVDPFMAEKTMNMDSWFESVDLVSDSYASFTLPTEVSGSVDEPSPPTSKGGRKRARPSDGLTKSVSEIANSLSLFFEYTNDRLVDIAKGINYEADGRDARKNLNDELIKLPLDLEDRMRAFLSISKSDTLVDIFFSLKLEEERMTFIRRVLHNL